MKMLKSNKWTLLYRIFLTISVWMTTIVVGYCLSRLLNIESFIYRWLLLYPFVMLSIYSTIWLWSSRSITNKEYDKQLKQKVNQ